MRTKSEYKKRTDKINNCIVDLLNEKICIEQEITELKKKDGDSLFKPSSETEIFKKIIERNTYFPQEALLRVFREINSASKANEPTVKVSCLGPSGTFSEEAAILKFGESAELVYGKDHRSTFDILLDGKADYCIVPYRNSTDGPVVPSLQILKQDLFLKKSKFGIVGECYIDVKLMVLGIPGQQVQTIFSHSKAFEQCSDYLNIYFPNARRERTDSTANAAQRAVETPNSACIAGQSVLRKNPSLQYIATDIQDNKLNQTKFVIVGNGICNLTGDDLTCLTFCLKDEPGTLSRFLNVLERRSINLKTLILVPNRAEAWKDVFFMEIEGHIADPNLKNALAEMSDLSQKLKSLGSYPRTGDFRS